MEDKQNTIVTLASYPEDQLKVENFRVEHASIRTLEKGEYLIEVDYVSVDPYVRPRLAGTTSYVSPVGLGNAIPSEMVGHVVESNSERFPVGTAVSGFCSWQSYIIASETDVLINAVPDSDVDKKVYVNTVATSGRTAYFGMFRIAHLKPGETLVVSAASGSVGSIAGQIGKLEGGYVVGIAGTEEKCRYVKEVLGFDECINYKDSDFSQQLKNVCPNGVDVYFENVGGRVSSIVARFLNPGARVPICGSVSSYDRKGANPSGPADFFSSLPEPPINRFFIVTEWVRHYPESDKWLLDALKNGKLVHYETVTKGLENAPRILIDILNARHFGKQIIEISTAQ